MEKKKCDDVINNCPFGVLIDGQRRYTSYDKSIQKCIVCQESIGGYDELFCDVCAENGEGKCDPGRCPSDIWIPTASIRKSTSYHTK